MKTPIAFISIAFISMTLVAFGQRPGLGPCEIQEAIEKAMKGRAELGMTSWAVSPAPRPAPPATVPVSALRKVPKAAAKALRQAAKASQHGDHETARRRIEEALRVDPANPESHVLLGVELADLGDVVAAEQEFARAVELDSRFALAYYNLAVLQQRSGRLAEAEASIRKALRLAPNEAHARLLLGYILWFGTGSRAEARELMKSSIKEVPEAKGFVTSLLESDYRP